MSEARQEAPEAAVEALVRFRHPLIAQYTLVIKQRVAEDARRDIEAALPALCKQERQRVREALLSEDVRREIGDIAANNGDAEDIAQLVRKLLAARLAALDSLEDPDPEQLYTLSEIEEKLLGEDAVNAALDAAAQARTLGHTDPPPTQRGIEAAINHAFNTERER